jgi:uncharacterized damage-inducible protein DinB
VSGQASAGLAVVEEQFDSMVDFLRPLGDDELNWTPPAPDTNSIAAMTIHICGSLDSWLSRVVGEQVERDRDAEFHARATAGALVERVERCRVDTRRRMAALEGRDLSGTMSVRRNAGAHAGQMQDVSLAWCVEHAIIHAGEHWGQIQLTHQLYAARG